MAPLHARSLGDAPLADAFALPGCPICRRIDGSAARFLDAILLERVNDVAFRADLDARRGFCQLHVDAILAGNRSSTGGTLAAAILLRAMLAIRRRELDAARSQRGRGRARQLADAAAAPDCPLCEQSRETEADAIAALARLADDPDWTAALARAPICLRHLVRLLAAPGPASAWATVESAQADRLARLEARLEAFIHHSSQDRRDLLTPEEEASADDVARLLGRG